MARIEKATSRIIHQIWGNNPNKAVLAALRNTNDISSKTATVVWPLLLANLDKRDLSIDGQPTYGERAIFAALHCYAIYQQGQSDSVYASATKETNGKTVFMALAALRRDENMRTAVDRRVQNILGNTNPVSVINAVGHLVSILKNRTPKNMIDFAQLGQDFYWLQLNSETARQVSLKWGQEYYWQSEKQ